MLLASLRSAIFQRVENFKAEIKEENLISNFKKYWKNLLILDKRNRSWKSVYVKISVHFCKSKSGLFPVWKARVNSKAQKQFQKTSQLKIQQLNMSSILNFLDIWTDLNMENLTLMVSYCKIISIKKVQRLNFRIIFSKKIFFRAEAPFRPQTAAAQNSKLHFQVLTQIPTRFAKMENRSARTETTILEWDLLPIPAKKPETQTASLKRFLKSRLQLRKLLGLLMSKYSWTARQNGRKETDRRFQDFRTSSKATGKNWRTRSRKNFISTIGSAVSFDIFS